MVLSMKSPTRQMQTYTVAEKASVCQRLNQLTTPMSAVPLPGARGRGGLFRPKTLAGMPAVKPVMPHATVCSQTSHKMAYVVEKSKDKQFTLAEVAEHASDKSRFIIINDNVYDVTKFIDEHPGGVETLSEFEGKDGTSGFEDVGHSADALKLLEDLQVGVLAESEKGKKSKKDIKKKELKINGSKDSSWLPIILIAVLAVIAAVGYKLFVEGN